MAIATNAKFGVTLEEEALRHYLAALAAGCPHAVTSDYRDPNLQAELFHENYTRDYEASAKYDGKKWGTVWYYRRRANARTGKATVSVAVPGTSTHETGRALDLAEPARTWMHKNGAGFGFINPDWAKEKATFEPWHFEFIGPTTTLKEDVMTPEQEKKLDQVLDLVRPGVAGKYSDGDLASMVRQARNAAQAAQDATKGLRTVKLYDSVKRVIKKAGWKAQDATYLEAAAPYAMGALAIAEKTFDELEETRADLTAARAEIAALRELLTGVPVEAELGEITIPTLDEIKQAVRAVLAEPYQNKES